MGYGWRRLAADRLGFDTVREAGSRAHISMNSLSVATVTIMLFTEGHVIAARPPSAAALSPAPPHASGALALQLPVQMQSPLLREQRQGTSGKARCSETLLGQGWHVPVAVDGCASCCHQQCCPQLNRQPTRARRG
jgi:hypothetical protein